MMSVYRLAAVVTLGALVLGAPLLHAGYVSQNFNSVGTGNEWPAAPTGLEIGDYSSTNGWELYSGIIIPQYTYDGHSGWLGPYTAPETQILATPLLSQGANEISYVVRMSGVGSSVYRLQTSTNGAAPWATLATMTNSSTAWTAKTNRFDDLYGDRYLRFVRDSGGNYLGFDEITIEKPSAIVTFTDTGTEPAIVYVDSPVTIVSTITPLGDVSGLTVTSFWRTASGPWNPSQMTNSGANVWRSTSAIPGQSFGSRIYFYVEASFSGTGDRSPMGDPVEKDGAPYYFDPAVRAYESGYDTLNVTGVLATAMSLIGDYTWEGVAESAGPETDVEFRFQGVDTNAAPHTWGDNTPPPGVMPLRGTAVEEEAPITIPGTNSGQFVFSFIETSRAYEVRQCVFHDFSGWSIDPYGNGSDDGWSAVNASIKTDSDRAYIGNACYLNSNTTSYIRSPYLEHGAGRISFYYRNWLTNAVVTQTEFYIQKSKTGGSDPSEWITIATEEDVEVQEYGPYSLLINDRYYPYVRVLNSTNPASRARLCIDNFMITQAGAGVVFTNAATDPLEPRVIDPVDISVDILSRAHATDRSATLYYRQGGMTNFAPIALNRSGDTFSTSESIVFTGEGSSNVEYYVECSFTGHESELASPTLYPDGGSNAPLIYTVKPAVSFSNPTLTPGSPTISSLVTVRVDIATTPGVEGLTASLWYRAGGNGLFDASTMTLISGTTYEGVIPRGQIGLMQYFVEANYSGSEIAHYVSSYSPTDRENNPLSYVNGDTTRTQNFNSVGTGNEWPDAPTGFTIGDYSSTNGWELYDGIVIPQLTYDGHSGWLAPSSQSSETYLLSPLLENGIGVLSFVLKCSSGGTSAYIVERLDTNGSPVEVIADTSQSGTTWTPLNYTVDAPDSGYIRIRKLIDTAGNPYLGMDEISITYPSARIDISEVAYSPAYPSRHVPTTISCVITSATSIFPAMSLTAQLRHREKDSGGAWSSPIAMTRSAGNVFSATIPAVYEEGESVEYYIESTFGGYYASAAHNHSPTYYPAGPIVRTTQYYDPPTSGFPSFTNRFYNSPYREVEVVGTFGSEPMEQVDDNIWECVITTDATDALYMGVAGLYRRDNSLSAPTFDAWGDTNQWRATLPVFGALDPNGGNIQLQGLLDGQYIVRVDLNTGDYIILRVDYQDFDHWFLNENLFDHGSRDRNSTHTVQDFDTWTNETDKVYATGFEGAWTGYTNSIWYGETDLSGWVAYKFRSVDAGGGRHRLDLIDQPDQGFVRQGNAQLTKEDGVGVAAVTYRAVDTNVYPTIYSGENFSNNVRITVSVDCSETHSDKGAYFSIFYRYMDSSNHYEMRLEQNGAGAMVPSIYKTLSGTTTLAYTGGARGGTLSSLAPNVIQMEVRTNNVHNLWVGGQHWISRTDATVPGPGRFGFGVRDASVRIHDITVQTNAVDAYVEYFTNATATGWSTGGNGWIINEASDTYERVGRMGGGLGLQIGTTPKAFPNDYTEMDVAADITGITSLDYVTTNVVIHDAEERHLALFHRAGGGTLRLDDVSVSGWRAFTNTYGPTGIVWTAANTWIAGDSRVTTNMRESAPHSLELRASRAIDFSGGSQFLRTPEQDTLGMASMRYLIPDGHPDATIVVEYSDDLDRYDFQPLATNTLVAAASWKTWSLPINKNEEPRKLHLRIRHASTDANARFYIDEFEVTPYFEGDTNGWVTYNALLSQTTELLTDDGENLVYSGGSARSGFLNYSTTNDIAGLPLTNGNPYVRSPYLALGIGEISLWHRCWPVTNSVASNALLRIEMSPDATPGSWQTILSTNLTNTQWQRLVMPFYDASNHFVRVSNVISPTPPDRLALDRLAIKAPFATDLLVTNVTIAPAVPLYTDDVTVHAELTDYLLHPTVTQVRAYYHVGTNQWGTWTEDQYVTLAYDESASDLGANPPVYAYKSTTDIPAQGIDVTVQYRIKVEFDGALLAEKTSPKIHAQPGPNPSWYEPVNLNQSLGGPDAQTPYYIVFSCPPGAVWINEINVLEDSAFPWGEKEYIELAATSGTDIANWRLSIENAVQQTSGVYRITNNTVIANESDGYGFWVLGDTNVAIPYDQTFTNQADESGNHMPHTGGIKLIRSMGAVEQALSYSTDLGFPSDAQNMAGFTYIPHVELWFGANSLSLVGTGVTAFAWSASVLESPGAVNSGQNFILNAPPATFTLLIEDIECGSNIVLWTTYTNSLTPYVMYSTNLLNSNAWDHVTNESWEVSNDSFRIWFPVLTNAPAHFYRVTATN